MRPALRLLPLPLCIAFSLGATAQAQEWDWDREPPEDWRLCPLEDAVPVFPDAPQPVGTSADRQQQPTDIDGDSVSGVRDEVINFDGNVTLRRGDQFLATDNLDYNEETGHYVADGSVRYQDSGMRIVAERLRGNPDQDMHEIENVQYQLIERRGNGRADRAEMVGDLGSMYGSTYSTCPPEDRHWELRARQIDVDTESGWGTARGASLRLGRFPLLYMPYFRFPVDDRRKTGLLYPGIDYSGRNGFDYRQPIYLNLAPNYDMTLEPRIMTDRGFMLGTEARYLSRRGGAELYFEYLPSDDITARERQEEIDLGIPEENRREEDRGMFQFSGSHRFNRTWQARGNLNWISDPRYLEDMSSSLTAGSPISIVSTAGLYGRGRYWEAGLMADYNQLADYTLSERNLPYNRLPRLFGSWEQPFRPWLVAGLDVDLTRFAATDDQRYGGSRFDAKPYVSFPLEGAAWFVRPTLAWRSTAYQLDERLAQSLALEGAEPDRSPTRNQPIASVDAGLFFDRDTVFRGDRYLHTLEPRLFYLNSPYRNQDNLPLFDTRALTFSWGQLFRDNRFSGGDRQADANQMTVALTTRLIRESDGLEKLSASIGQIRYFDDSRVGLNPKAPPVESGESSWVAEAAYAINDRWTLNAGYQWDPKIRRDDLISVRSRYLIGDDGIANLGYRYRRELLEQVDFSFLYPLSPAWSLVGRYYYSLKDSSLLESIAGVQWDSCCVTVRLVGRRYVRNRIGEMNDAIQLEVELKGLGSLGANTEDRLRRAILGYYRDDLYLVPPSDLRGDPVQIDPIQ
ncbi:LPS-assembly protein LptD [Luteimonas huabeiensis]|uniref:LPS-assembly protein LptD n=1 Tax=Luteimonas huabeiensis TaxID=1244513 RepID=UPI000467ECB6|nr:LPS-assembly protein LptD [Luteimonas huabeiensis]